MIGDSHGGRLAAGINEVLGEKTSGYLVKKQGALPAELAKTYVDGSPHPDDFNKEIEYAVDQWKGDYIFLHGFFSYYWWGDTSYPGYQVRLVGTSDHGPSSVEESQANFVQDIQTTFARLAHAKAKVVVVGSVPNPGINTGECMRRPEFIIGFDRLQASCWGISKDAIVAKAKSVNDMLAKEAEAAGLIFVNPLDVFCPSDQADCLRSSDGKLLYSDDNHLNIIGARILTRYVFDRIAKSR